MVILKTRKDFHIERLVNFYDKAPTIVCDNLKSPENIGSFLRLADTFGCEEVIYLDDSKELETKVRNKVRNKVRRWLKTSCGTERHVNHSFITSENFLIKIRPIPLIAVELTDNATSIFEAEMPMECYFVFGNESRGISEEILQCCNESIYIPMYGLNNSMNVAHAASIVLYEWRRRFSG